MTVYAYNPIAYQMASQITGRDTQAIQNRFEKINAGEHNEWDRDDLTNLVEFCGSLSWGDLWDRLNTMDRDEFEEGMLDILSYIVGDSW